MENSEIVIKSLLKKSASTDFCKSKKVSFCNTVKMFIDDPSKSIKTNSEEGAAMKWVEISIVDKSTGSVNPEANDDCKVTDFLVHKVIYDNYVLPENDEDLDIINEDNHSSNSIVLESVSDDEGLEFVVHKVTDHEDDLIKQESDLDISVNENENAELENSDEITKPFSKLSVENILEHDKIIAFIDQRSLAFSSLNKPIGISNSEKKGVKGLPEKVDNTLVLSPPLQELSIEKIVKAHSDNILCELDISPLNSVQESDSESDLSSEGTMIMMTSEECQKNEQHIRESFLQYQSRKKLSEVESAQSSKPESENTESDCDIPDTVASSDDSFTRPENEFELDESNSKDVNSVPSCNGISRSDELSDSISPNSSCFSPNEDNPHKRSNSLPISDTAFSQPNKQGPKFFSAMRRSSFDSCAQIPPKTPSFIKIPSDVREWKILLDSCGKSEEETVPEPSLRPADSENALQESSSKSDSSIPLSASSPSSKTDELESFVNESTERVERIRKRYHVNGRQNRRFGNLQHSPVRGIRPRFGSTAQILQMMQKQNNPPVITFGGNKNHMSWPCDETGSDSVLGMHSSHFYISQSDCSSQSSIDSFSEDPLSSASSCDHYSISSCPSIIFHERGSPEGASPSRPIEICDSTSESSFHSDSYVYYSMKV